MSANGDVQGVLKKVLLAYMQQTDAAYNIATQKTKVVCREQGSDRKLSWIDVKVLLTRSDDQLAKGTSENPMVDYNSAQNCKSDKIVG